MSGAHTPTPWIVRNDKPQRYPGLLILAGDRRIAEVKYSPAGDDSINAAFIVEACNAHDSLKALAGEAYPGIAHDLETLKAQNAELVKALRKVFDVDVEPRISDRERVAKAVRVARAALAGVTP